MVSKLKITLNAVFNTAIDNDLMLNKPLSQP